MTAARPASDEGATWTLDDLAAGLRELRADAGSPSYARIAEGIAEARRARGVPEPECHVGRVTVYDCFRAGRRRLDADLVAEIVEALGGDAATAEHWRQRSSAAQHRRDAGMVGTATAPVPPPEEPSIDRPELAAVVAAVEAGARVVVVDGLAGSGKTQLARRAAQRLVASGRLAGGLQVDLRGFHDGLPPVATEAALTAAVRALGGGAAPAALPTRRQQYADLLRARPHVVVLDDAADEEQVRPLLVRAGPTVHLVTSRLALLPDVPDRVTLGSFTPRESVHLLGAIAGADRVAAEPEAAAALAEATGHLPLAVSLAATRVPRATTGRWPISSRWRTPGAAACGSTTPSPRPSRRRTRRSARRRPGCSGCCPPCRSSTSTRRPSRRSPGRRRRRRPRPWRSCGATTCSSAPRRPACGCTRWSARSRSTGPTTRTDRSSARRRSAGSRSTCSPWPGPTTSTCAPAAAGRRRPASSCPTSTPTRRAAGSIASPTRCCCSPAWPTGP
ncbi:hypothetical protein [Nocardioides humi]|uniref:hypothetical protein n=1 Tax=Nocardioides humi TaxID=449461 RepID=UPI001FEC4DCF|nr:hypothetical protein [Nocardioides humi]